MEKLDRYAYMRNKFVGQEYFSSCGEPMVIISQNGKRCDIKWKVSGIVETDLTTSNVRGGLVRYKNKKGAAGVGYLGFGDFPNKGVFSRLTDEESKRVQSVWVGMINRCYNEKMLVKNPNYRDVHVSEEWKSLQNFARWMIFQDNCFRKDDKGKYWQIDKDIVNSKDKNYSSESCVFVPSNVNLFFKNTYTSELGYGVCLQQTDFGSGSSIISLCRNPLTGKQHRKTGFSRAEDAELYHINLKIKYARDLAVELVDSGIDHRVIKELYNFNFLKHFGVK